MSSLSISLAYLSLLLFLFINCTDPHRQEDEGVYTEYSLLSSKCEIKRFRYNGKETKPIIILQNSPYSYFLPDDINPKESQTAQFIEDKLININSDVYRADEYKDSLKFPKLEHLFKDFHFYVLNSANTKLPSKQGIGLAFKMKGEDYSLVHHLYNTNVIKKLSYTLKPSSFLDGKLYFGEVPVNQFARPKVKGICKVDEKFSTWGCHMNKIILENSTNVVYSYNNYSSFQINKKIATTPCSFVYFVKEKLIPKEFSSGECKIVKENLKITIECLEFSTVLKFPTIHIIFDEFKIIRRLRDMFVCYKDRNCYSLFKCYEGMDQWAFGNSFMQDFVATFDYNDKTVELYTRSLGNDIMVELTEDERKIETKEALQKTGTDNSSVRLTILFIIMTLTGLMLFNNLYISYISKTILE